MTTADPFLPFTRPSIDEQTIADVGEVLRSGWLTTGGRCLELETALSDRFGRRPVRLASSASAALEMALRLIDVGPGDEVITTPLSWVATGNVILHNGARPVFVDVEPATRNIDLALVETAVTPRTRALLPVDLAGLPVDRKRLYEIAGRFRLRVIEDAAQSMGSICQDREIGCGGDLVAISFHANKNITTGEGGCLVMNNDDEAGKFEQLRLQGVIRGPDGSMDVALLGGKSNLTDIAAAIGLGQLRQLDTFNRLRRQLAKRYFEVFDALSLDIELPLRDEVNSNWHMFQVVLPKDVPRPQFIAAMRSRGIGVGVHFPAMHLFSLYRSLGYRPGQFPHAERIGARIVSLPLFPAMSVADVERVGEAMTQVLS